MCSDNNAILTPVNNWTSLRSFTESDAKQSQSLQNRLLKSILVVIIYLLSVTSIYLAIFL